MIDAERFPARDLERFRWDGGPELCYYPNMEGNRGQVMTCMNSARRRTVEQCSKRNSWRSVWLVLVAILLVSMIALAGCRAKVTGPLPSTETAPAVPQRANFLAKVELAEIINDEDFAELYHEVAAQEATLPESLDAALDRVRNETGVNLRDFSDATVFADALSLPESMECYPSSAGVRYWGVLVEGELDESSFVDSMESQIGRELPRSNYQNLTIYALGDLDGQDEALSMAFPSDGQVVIGTDPAVRDVIEVTVGLEEPISGTVYDLYGELGDVPLKLASSVPESLTEQIPAEMPIGPVSLSLLCFRDIKYATLTLAKNETIVDAELCLVFSSEDSARDSQLLLWLGSELGENLVSDPNVGELITKTQISRSGTSVSLTLRLAMSEIEQLILALLQEQQ